MQAVVLSAGMGTRLTPLTKVVPKCLVEVAGIPILEWQLTALLDSGIRDIIVVVGYKGNQVRQFIEAQFPDGAIQIINNREYKTTNNMYSLYLTEKHVKGDLLVLNGDVVLAASIVRALMESNYEDAIAVDERVFNDESMKVAVGPVSIVDISKQIPRDEAAGVSIDLYKFSDRGRQKLFKEIKKVVEIERDRNQWTEVAIQRILKKGLSVRPVDIAGEGWTEIDNYEDLEQAEITFNPKAATVATKEVFFLDGDGTAYIGDKLLPGTKEVVAWIRGHQKKFYIITNNSSRSKAEYVKQLNSMGLSVNQEEIISSTDMTINYLKEKDYRDVYVLGTPSFERELSENGVNTVNDSPQAVVLGFDKTLTYAKIEKAAHFIQKGIPFIATHADRVCPTENGYVPDAGAMIALLETATGVKPAVLGKPNENVILQKLQEIGFSSSQALIIGDRLYTDVMMGRNARVDTVCVLTGEATREEINLAQVKPSLVLSSLKGMLTLLEQQDHEVS